MTARILIVEDQPEIAKVIHRRVGEITKPERFDVEFSESLAQIPQGKVYAAVLLDLKLKNGMGIEVIEHTRQKLPTSPIIIVTGFVEYTQEEVIEAGAESIIYKDVALQPGVLENVIRVARARFRKRQEIEKEWSRKLKLVEELGKICQEISSCVKPEKKRESIPKRAASK